MKEIDLRKIDLNLLVVFDVLMTERSVTRAAVRLARTQSAVSHALARLREQVGDPLLVKVGGRMTPSPRAEILAGEVRSVLANIQRVLAAPRPFEPALSTRVFRVAIPDLSNSLFAALAADVGVEAPAVALEWVVRDAGTLLAVAEGRVDVALMPSAVRLPEGVEGTEAGTLRWATFARHDHPAVHEWGKAAWTRWSHVVVRVGEHMPSPVESAPGIRGGRRVGAWVPHFSAVAPLLARTDLLATLPLVVMADALDRYGLIALPPPIPLPPMPHRLVWSSRLAGEPGLRWICQHVQRVFGEVVSAAEAAVGGQIGKSRPRPGRRRI